MNYERAWHRLIKEIEGLSSQQVRSLDPEVVLGYMGFIEQVETYEAKQDIETR